MHFASPDFKIKITTPGTIKAIFHILNIIDGKVAVQPLSFHQFIYAYVRHQFILGHWEDFYNYVR